MTSSIYSSTTSDIIRDTTTSYVRDCVFNDISAENNAAVSLNNAVFTLVVRNVAFRNCRNQKPGGAIFARAKFVKIENTFGVNCYAPSSAFMDIEAEGGVVALNMTVNDCKATEGNIISVKGTAEFTNCVFTKNVAHQNIITITTAYFKDISFKKNSLISGNSMLSFKNFTVKGSKIHVNKDLYVVDSKSSGVFEETAFNCESKFVSKANNHVIIKNCTFETVPFNVRHMLDDDDESAEGSADASESAASSESTDFDEDDETTNEESQTQTPEPTKYDLQDASIAGCVVGSVIVLAIIVLLVIRLIPRKKPEDDNEEEGELIAREVQQVNEEEDAPMEYQFTTNNDPEMQAMQPKRKVVIIPDLNSDEEL